MPKYKQASGQGRQPRHWQAPKVRERSATAIALSLFLSLFAAIGGMLAYYFLLNPDVLVSGGKQPEAVIKTRIVTFADARFAFPGHTYNKTRRNALGRKIGIRLLVPTDWSENSQARIYTHDSSLEDWIIVNIQHTEKGRTAKTWLKRIYRQYIDGPATSHRSGLFRYQFRSDSPYADLELFTDNLDNPKMIIRCERQNENLNTRLCTRHMPINSKITAKYRFSRLRLQNWKQIHEVMIRYIRVTYRRARA